MNDPNINLSLEDIFRTRQQIRSLMECPGWKWLQGELAGEANEIVERWRMGSWKEAQHEAMAARMKMIDDIMYLPERTDAMLNQLQKDIKNEDNADKPEYDDEDKYPMSPQPDEGDGS